ncbi:MAG: hypothetical protein ACJ790_20295, partial [Myxococcaceae bacterium]
MFGAAGTPAAPPRSSTQMFGAAGTPAAPPRSSTQMFGAASDADSQDSDSQDADEPKPPDRASSTMIFGNPFAERPPGSAPAAAPGKPAQMPRVPMSGAGSTTMIFGRTGAAPASPEADDAEADPPPEIPRPERTMRFGLADIEAAHKAKQAELAAAKAPPPEPKRTTSIEVDLNFDVPTTPLGTPSAQPTPPPMEAAPEPQAAAEPFAAPEFDDAPAPSVELPPERPAPIPL